MSNNTPYLQNKAIEELIDQMTTAIKTRLDTYGISKPAMIGIHTGGVWIAKRLHRNLAIEESLGTLDISFYRDDFTRIGMNPQVKPSHIPFNVEGRHILLVDDVIQSGRTVRAAMNEIFDYGRPASITLIALVERSGRELPIQPSVVGVRPPLKLDETITLTGPNELALVIGKSKKTARNCDEQ